MLQYLYVETRCLASLVYSYYNYYYRDAIKLRDARHRVSTIAITALGFIASLYYYYRDAIKQETRGIASLQ
ncbi:MAG: hypothetical protein VSS75_009240 [Candidatus Parabeggiatoa sp.]|nr:hypothetical protein [Candidatus Parabeggiatoa sp.]